MSAEHTIRTVADFSAIPADKISACLSDFADYLETVRKVNAFPEVVGAALGIPAWSVSMHDDCFLWIDDGVGGISALQLTDHNGDVLGRVNLMDSEAAK